MRIIIHLSDLHFGRVDGAILEPLLSFILRAQPHLVVVSGDLTQRARTAQFVEARQFLDRIPFPLLVVPGNHDIPLHNLFARFARPLGNYRRYICDDLSPFFHDDEIAVAGINTARSFTSKYGRINSRQIDTLIERFRPLGKDIVRVVVTHHPFDLPPGYADRHQLVGRAEMAMKALAASGVDLLLSGHLHLNYIGFTIDRYKIAGHSALVVQAGTATSTRVRDLNSFNVLKVASNHITVERMLWNPDLRDVSLAATSSFNRTPVGWKQMDEVDTESHRQP